MTNAKKGEPSGSPFSWNFEYPSPRSFATKIFPIKIRIRPFPSILAPSCASYTPMRRSLSFYPNLLYILPPFCQSLSMSFFRPWFARPRKLEIPWWLSCRWLLASSSLLALVHFSLLHPVCEVLSHFTSLNSFISFKIRF